MHLHGSNSEGAFSHGPLFETFLFLVSTADGSTGGSTGGSTRHATLAGSLFILFLAPIFFEELTGPSSKALDNIDRVFRFAFTRQSHSLEYHWFRQGSLHCHPQVILKGKDRGRKKSRTGLRRDHYPKSRRLSADYRDHSWGLHDAQSVAPMVLPESV